MKCEKCEKSYHFTGKCKPCRDKAGTLHGIKHGHGYTRIKYDSLGFAIAIVDAKSKVLKVLS